MRKIGIIIAALVFVTSGCDKQRDLYVKAGPMLYVEGDWLPSLGKTDMYMNATAVVYKKEAGMFRKEYFFAPDYVTVPVEKGDYDVVIFNGLMYSAEDTHLDNVYFRGIDGFDTFEAVAVEAEANRRLGKSEGEYIASNDMEIITSASDEQPIDGSSSYYLKYKNGKKRLRCAG